jgi:starch-binding outer membrane protein, SusD/RagB family
MYFNINSKKIFVALAAVALTAGSCTKLHENLSSTLVTADANKFSNLFLQAAYNDVGVVYEDLGNVLQLEEVTTDECIVPIRGTDWYDGGYHVQLHLHNWTRSSVSLLENMFTNLNKINYDATAVLGTDGTPDQLAQARFLRAFSLYQLMELFGQFPLRQPGDNLLLPSKVYSGDSATQFIISELQAAIPNLNPSNGTTLANPDAARALLMRTYLNRGAFKSLAAPTFDDADMQQVIALGDTVLAHWNYGWETNYFDIFSASNATTKESLFSLPNARGANTSSGFYPNMQNQWFSTLHYNSYSGLEGQSGWNGFSTMGEFYNTFAVNGGTASQTRADTTLDSRLGLQAYAGVTDHSGILPGFLINQQYDSLGNAEQDRKGNPLFFTNASEIPATIDVSFLPNLESAGYRVVKYSPDLATGKISYSVPGNYYIMLRQADVLLMVAEAKMRAGAADDAGALALVNKLRVARNAAPLTTMTLNTPGNVYDANTLLAERGREMYWEGTRRIDLIRFGMFTAPWRLKPADNGNYYLFPVPLDDLNANSNLIVNLQGSNY